MNTLLDTLRSLGPIRLGAMALIGAGILAFFVFLTSRLASPDLTLLYSELDGADSSQIAARLEQMNLPYRLSPDGGQIFVPPDRVGSLRLAMAAEGIPSGGSVGYEIFDRSEGLGTTNFVQGINHLRALEGELARTISSIGRVKQARVHLVLPRRELFSRDRQEPSASIVLTMSGNRRLDRNQVLAIQHLTASAVPELEPNMVSIVDNQGTLLARGASEDNPTGTAGTSDEMRVAYETRMARTIEDLIERSVGRGNVRAEVSSEMDFDRITENAEIYDPDGQVVRSSQTVEETSNSSDAEPAPPVTVGNNLPDAGLLELDEGSSSQSQSSRIEETVNYEITRTIKTHVRESGLVRRLSVAVLINGVVTEDANGEPLYEPRGEEEMAQIATLVRSAVGINEERGDTIEVVNLRFVEIEVLDEEESFGGILGFNYAELMRIAEIVVLGMVGILVLLLVVRPLVVQLIESQAAGASRDQNLLGGPVSGHPALAAAGPQAALAGPGGGVPGIPGAEGAFVPGQGESDSEVDRLIDMNKVDGRVRASSIKKIGEIVEKHPEESVAIVRNWLYQEE